MAKIIEISHAPGEEQIYHSTVLIYGKEYTFAALNLNHLIEKILHRDKHETKENIEMDLALNFAQIE